MLCLEVNGCCFAPVLQCRMCVAPDILIDLTCARRSQPVFDRMKYDTPEELLLRPQTPVSDARSMPPSET